MEGHPGALVYMVWMLLQSALVTGGHALNVKASAVDSQFQPSDEIDGVKKCDGIRQLFADGLMKVEEFLTKLRACNGDSDREPNVFEVANMESNEAIGHQPAELRYPHQRIEAVERRVPMIDTTYTDGKRGVARVMIHPNQQQAPAEEAFQYQRVPDGVMTRFAPQQTDAVEAGNLREQTREPLAEQSFKLMTDNRNPGLLQRNTAAPSGMLMLPGANTNTVERTLTVDPKPRAYQERFRTADQQAYRHPFQIVKKDDFANVAATPSESGLAYKNMNFNAALLDAPSQEKVNLLRAYDGRTQFPLKRGFVTEATLQHDSAVPDGSQATPDLEETPTVMNYGDLLSMGLHDSASFMEAGPENGHEEMLTLNAYESMFPSVAPASVSRSYIDVNKPDATQSQGMGTNHVIPYQSESALTQRPEIISHESANSVLSPVKPLNEAKSEVHSDAVTAANLAAIFKELDEEPDDRQKEIAKKDHVMEASDRGIELAPNKKSVEPILVEPRVASTVVKQHPIVGAEPKDPGFNLAQIAPSANREVLPITTKKANISEATKPVVKKSLLSKKIRLGFNLQRLKYGLNNGNSV